MTAIAKRGRPRTWNCSPQTVLSRTGEERELVALTLPHLSILHVTGGDLKEAATRFAEYRILRAGRDAWQAINKAESFDGWKAIGKALAIGRDHALRSTGANAPHGRRYSLAFSAWAKEHGFGEMQKGVRSIALELHANIEAITEWRAASGSFTP